MATSRRQFKKITYVDEGTNKTYDIPIRTVDDDTDVLFEAEVRFPVQFTDRDANFRALKARVLARCAADRKLVWEPYYLAIGSSDGFAPSKEGLDLDPLAFHPSRRNSWNVGLTFEIFESAVLEPATEAKEEVRIWRAIAGQSSRFGSQATPGWPEAGRTKYGHMNRYLQATKENGELLRNLFYTFRAVAIGMGVALDPDGRKVLETFFSKRDDKSVWARLRAQLDKKLSGDSKTEEATCPSNDPKSSTAATLATATAPHA
jgi:hypothetical protein